MSKRIKEWAEDHVAALSIAMGFVTVIFVAIVGVTGGYGATTDHPEGDFGGPGTQSIVVHQHRDGSEAIVEQGIRPVHVGRGNFSEFGTWPYKYDCTLAWQRITYEDRFGFDQNKSLNQVQWCFNGHKVLSYAIKRTCWQRSGDAYVVPRQKTTRLTNWNGYANGALHSYLRCVYAGGFPDHEIEVVAFGDGHRSFPENDSP